ncbi:MAG: hypothetical protein EA409_09670 [Saprospirales bacterium]|nr:MAG: hypothetical protein EA409_09670 [Saprospirales bacterium]
MSIPISGLVNDAFPMRLIIFIFCFIFFQQWALSQVAASIEFQGLNREFLVYKPEIKFSPDGYPLVIALHGFTQNERRIMNYTGFNHLADEHGFIVVYPRGIQASWNFGISHNEVNDPLFLNALIDTLLEVHSIDKTRIYFTGFSNGGFMSYEMACHFSHRVAAIASVTGSMSANQMNRCNPEYPVGILQIHGTTDNVIHYEGQSWVQSIDDVMGFWVLENGCRSLADTSLVYRDKSELISVKNISYEPCEDRVDVRLLKVIEGGHTWPGSAARSGSGRTNRDISASEEIWNFLIRHRRLNSVERWD